jgi:hypothetical protein
LPSKGLGIVDAALISVHLKQICAAKPEKKIPEAVL